MFPPISANGRTDAMWSTFTDRERAEQALRDKPLTDGQERQKLSREDHFTRGYDAAVRAYLSERLLEAFDLTADAYRRRRKAAFEEADLAWRLQGIETRRTKVAGVTA